MAVVNEEESGKSVVKSGGLFGSGDVKKAPADPVLPDPYDKEPSTLLINVSYAPEPRFTFGYFGEYIRSRSFGPGWKKAANLVDVSNARGSKYQPSSFGAGFSGAMGINSYFGIGFQTFRLVSDFADDIHSSVWAPPLEMSFSNNITVEMSSILLGGYARIGKSHGWNIMANAYAGVSSILSTYNQEFRDWSTSSVRHGTWHAYASASGLAPSMAFGAELGIPLGQWSVRQWMQMYIGFSLRRVYFPEFKWDEDSDINGDNLVDYQKGAPVMDSEGKKLDIQMTTTQTVVGFRAAF